MITGSKIQASLGQPVEIFWAVYIDGQLERGYINNKVKACIVAQQYRNAGHKKVRVVRQ